MKLLHKWFVKEINGCSQKKNQQTKGMVANIEAPIGTE